MGWYFQREPILHSPAPALFATVWWNTIYYGAVPEEPQNQETCVLLAVPPVLTIIKIHQGLIYFVDSLGQHSIVYSLLCNIIALQQSKFMMSGMAISEAGRTYFQVAKMVPVYYLHYSVIHKIQTHSMTKIHVLPLM